MVSDKNIRMIRVFRLYFIFCHFSNSASFEFEKSVLRQKD